MDIIERRRWYSRTVASGGGSLSYLDTVAAIDGAVYWTFDEASGTTAKAYDSGGENSSYNGTYSGAYTLANVEFPKTGLSVATNPGSNAYVELDNAAMDALVGNWSAFTIALWWRPTNTAALNAMYFRHNAFGAENLISAYKNSTDATLGLKINDTAISLGALQSYSTNVWRFSYISYQDNSQPGGGKFHWRLNESTGTGTHTQTSARSGFTTARVGGAINLTDTLAGQVGLLVVIPSYSESNDAVIYDGGIA